MYITEVSGHHQATKAIEKALKILDPSVETRKVNGFGFAFPIVEKIVNRAYMGIIKRTPQVWDYLYDNPKIVKRTQSLKEAIHKSKHEKIAKLFSEFKPDAVVCTQAFPCGMVADYKKVHQLKTKVIGILTDYAPHSFWLHDGVDYYVVPSKESKERFMSEGISRERIKLFGIPLDPKFAQPVDKNKIAQRLKLDPTIPTILIMGGGQGFGPIKAIVKTLLGVQTLFQLIVVAGTNQKLISWLNKIKAKSSRKIVVYGFTDNIDELMTMSMLVITKPGGMTITECLAKGLPIVIVKPIPGQESRNAQFLTQKGIAIRVNKLSELAGPIESLLLSPERLGAMRQAALFHSRPQSSFDIARLILRNET